MHPLTVYDIAIGDHERDTATRQREHLLAQQRREREVAREARRPVPAAERSPSTRPAVA